MQDLIINEVMLVDDHPLLRKGVAQLIELEDDLDVVGEADNGESAVQLAVRLEPDIILLDLNMDGMDGIETLKAMRTAEVTSKIIMFTVSDETDDVVNAIRAGADGYLLKDMEPEALVANLRHACNGQLVLSDKLNRVLAQALQSKQEKQSSNIDDLTKREKQILKLIAEGLSNKLIARKLDISEGTVKVHVKRVLKKLHLSSRVEAAVWVVENRIH